MATTFMANYQTPVTIGITALAGGGATNAPLMTSTWNSVDTVATGSDSVLLPPAIPNQYPFLWILNNQASNALAVFPNQTNPSNGNAADTVASSANSTYTTSITIAASKAALFVCTTLGKWKVWALSA